MLMENKKLNAPRTVHVTQQSSQSLRETLQIENLVNFFPPVVVHLVDVDKASGSQLGVELVEHLGLVDELGKSDLKVKENQG